ncbi:GntR family transcriptional regulator [Acinetobacter soli]|uniref:GntR family transcriptional regulator n=1 Tax=Acinetobacter soli TaxID=487316 RepID=UPI000E5A91C0|nr:GntR family transcriptional regulator [Acinetobacter soli]MBU3119882.1 GntR family transcriptional regulator [Acinetobacter soli]MDS7694807.1 GntR family transcriptional regulator [Acinetobacter soli]
MSSGQQVLIKLRKMIIAGELAGGSRIAEIPTAELLGVSRQPVRMAFRLLEQEGLLIKNPTRGYVVREISDQLIQDAIEVRGVLEGLAAKTLAEKGLNDEQKSTLKSCIEEIEKLFAAHSSFGDAEIETYDHFNAIFHDTILQGAKNIALMQALAKNNQLPFASAQAITFDSSQALSEYRRLHYAHLQHCSIYDALLHRQAGRAENLMREHSSVAILGETVRHLIAD